MIVASMSTTTHRCRCFPATVSQGKPPGRRASQVHTIRRTFARARATAASTVSSRPASSRRIVESEADGANTRCWWRASCSASRTLRGAERDGYRQVDEHHSPVAPSVSARWKHPGQHGDQPASVCQTTQQDGSAVTDDALAVRSDPQPPGPTRWCSAPERCPDFCTGYDFDTHILAGHGHLSAVRASTHPIQLNSRVQRNGWDARTSAGR